MRSMASAKASSSSWRVSALVWPCGRPSVGGGLQAVGDPLFEAHLPPFAWASFQRRYRAVRAPPRRIAPRGASPRRRRRPMARSRSLRRAGERHAPDRLPGRDRRQTGHTLRRHPEHVLETQPELLVEGACARSRSFAKSASRPTLPHTNASVGRVPDLAGERDRAVQHRARELWTAALDCVVGGVGVQEHELARASDLAQRRNGLVELRRSVFRRDASARSLSAKATSLSSPASRASDAGPRPPARAVAAAGGSRPTSRPASSRRASAMPPAHRPAGQGERVGCRARASPSTPASRTGIPAREQVGLCSAGPGAIADRRIVARRLERRLEPLEALGVPLRIHQNLAEQAGQPQAPARDRRAGGSSPAPPGSCRPRRRAWQPAASPR